MSKSSRDWTQRQWCYLLFLSHIHAYQKSRLLLIIPLILAIFIVCTLNSAGCGKKRLNGVDKYLLAFSSSTSRSRSRPIINLYTTTSPHTISTLHIFNPNTNHIAIMGNGAKAASKRERNAKDAGGVAKSQLKSVRFFFLCRSASPQ